MMSAMKTQDPREELQDGFELAPPPSEQAMQPERPPARPRLCEAGPCKHYHRLAVQVDAAQPGAVRTPVALPDGTPGAQSVPGGTVYQAAPAFHVQVHHYCYPDVGIEMPLGDLPVTECNRWEPRAPLLSPAEVVSRGTPPKTPAADAARPAEKRWEPTVLARDLATRVRAYLENVAAWEADHRKREAEAADIERSINESLAMAKESK
jgi:hypothetical protein